MCLIVFVVNLAIMFRYPNEGTQIVLATPGAYMINGAGGAQPILGSMISIVSNEDQDDAWMVAPGFKVELYNGNYGTMHGTINNTGGTQWLFVRVGTGVNTTESVKLYYGTQPIKGIYALESGTGDIQTINFSTTNPPTIS